MKEKNLRLPGRPILGDTEMAMERWRFRNFDNITYQVPIDVKRYGCSKVQVPSTGAYSAYWIICSQLLDFQALYPARANVKKFPKTNV